MLVNLVVAVVILELVEVLAIRFKEL